MRTIPKYTDYIAEKKSLSSTNVGAEMFKYQCSISEGAKEEYEKYFMDKLKEFDVDSPADMSDEDKIKFFNSIKDGWDKENHKPKK